MGLLAALWGASGQNPCGNATYTHRVDDPESYNWCIVPESGPDAFLFAGLAVMAACLMSTAPLSSVLVLLAGALSEAGVFSANLGRLGNAFSLWLGINPPALFFHAFLPPLLLDSALSLDFFLFKKVMLQVLAFAFLVVICSAALTTPFLLYVLGLRRQGWRWQHGALFSAMLAPTDACAIAAILKRAGGPEALITLMEGESLLNDASGIVLFELFHTLVRRIADRGGAAPTSVLSMVPLMAQEIARLALGGLLVGLAAGYAVRRLLRALRWRGASASQEVAAIQAASYLSYFCADSLLGFSGVIAVVAFGLLGNASSCFELGSSQRMRDAAAVQSTLTFALNGLVFFFAGASAVNFFIRSAASLFDLGWCLAAFPPLYLSLFAIRGVCILVFNPLFRLLGADSLSLRAVAFASWGGLRGAVSLIMAQVIVTDEVLAASSELIVAQIALWTALFVLSTLLINAPTVPPLLRATGLLELSPVKLSIQAKAKRSLLRYTAAAVRDLKQDEDEMLRGVDWAAVARYVDLSQELQPFAEGLPSAAGNGDGGKGGEGDAAAQARAQQQAAAALLGEGSTGGRASVPAQWQPEDLAGAGAGWAEPSSPAAVAASRLRSSRQAGALGDLTRPSPIGGLRSSHKLVGTSRTNLQQKWLPRSLTPRRSNSSGGGDEHRELGPGAEDSARVEEGGWGSWGSGGGEGSGSGAWDDEAGEGDLEAPLLAPRDVSHRASASFERASDASPAGSSSSLSRYLSRFEDGSVHRGGKAGADRETYFSEHAAEREALSAEQEGPEAGGGAAAGEAPGPPPVPPAVPPRRAQAQLPGAKSAPAMDTIVEIGTEEEASSSGGSSVHGGAGACAGSWQWGAAGSSLGSLGGGRGAGSTGGASSFAPLDMEAELQPGFSTGGMDLTLEPEVPARPAPTASLPPAPPRPLPAPPRLLAAPRGAAGAAGAEELASPRAAAASVLAPGSPRSMHGLVRLSLVPPQADRQAVLQCWETLSEPTSPVALVSQQGLEAGAAEPASPARTSSGAPRLQPRWQRGQHQHAARPLPESGASIEPLPEGGEIEVPLPKGVPPSPRFRPHLQLGGLEPPRPAAAGPAVPPLQLGGAATASAAAALPPRVSGPGLGHQQSSRLGPGRLSSGGDGGQSARGPAARPSGLASILAPPSPARISPYSSPEQQGLQDLPAGIAPPLQLAEPPPPGGVPAPAPAPALSAPAQLALLAGLPGIGLGATSDEESCEESTASSPPLPFSLRLRAQAAPAVLEPAATERHLLPPKPWRVGAEVLRRSKSSPLLGAAGAGAAGADVVFGCGRSTSGAAVNGGSVPPSPRGSAPLPGAAAGAAEPPAAWSSELVAEARVRLVAGLARYFHAKRTEGLLSAEGLRILSYACDRAVHQPHRPLHIWLLAEREVAGSPRVRLLSWLFFQLKRAASSLPRGSPLRVLRPPLRWVATLIGGVLSRVALVACEVAVEFWMGLTWSPQAQWLRESEAAGPLQSEIAAESGRVCGFIVDREVEAPERFQAIQSYRAAMAILRQQAAFVEQLFASGIVNEAERDAMMEPVARKTRQLELQGPTWRAPSVVEVLRSLPFLHHLPQPVFEALLEHGRLLEYARGQVIWAGAAPPPAASSRHAAGAGEPPSPRRPGGAVARGLSIVVYGLVRSSYTDSRGASHEVYLGTGGVLGLLSALVGEPLPGAGPAVAEANTLGKGPLIFHIPQGVIACVRQRAREGRHEFQQFELDLFRVAALYVVERMKSDVGAQLAATWQRLAVDRARRQAIHRAAVASGEAAAAAAQAPPPPWQQQEFVPLTYEEALAHVNPHQMWHDGQAFARRVLASLRHQLRDGQLVQLWPGEAWQQRGHAVLLHGALHSSAGGTGAAAGNGAAAGADARVQGPWVLPYAREGLAGGPGGSFGSGGAGTVVGGGRFCAGGRGAVLVVCRDASEPEPPTPSSASFEDGAPQRLAPSPFASAAPVGEAEGGAPREWEGEDAGPPRPLHRVASRRLPLSGSLLAMEMAAPQG